MRTYAAIAFLLLVGCSTNHSSPELQDALRAAKLLELHSLDPLPHQSGGGSTFQNWTDLGQTDVSATAVRARLLDALDAGIAENDGVANKCFDPRHGLRAIHNGKTYDVVICFHCFQVQWYIDDVRQPDFLLTGSPQPVFDTILRDAGVPLPPSAPD